MAWPWPAPTRSSPGFAGTVPGNVTNILTVSGTGDPNAADNTASATTTVLGIGDLSLIEVLQGCRAEKDFVAVQRLFGQLEFVVLGGSDVAVPAARVAWAAC